LEAMENPAKKLPSRDLRAEKPQSAMLNDIWFLKISRWATTCALRACLD
jgi:hypothetical protein